MWDSWLMAGATGAQKPRWAHSQEAEALKLSCFWA